MKVLPNKQIKTETMLIINQENLIEMESMPKNNHLYINLRKMNWINLLIVEPNPEVDGAK